ncbi:YbjN domain-containing protein [Brachybacterium hainanense]|uniref:YbjN domain-containing protein n=1 Tax=Brachybacterium hainanense TaxID=1541174 RepID=A0ABV6REU8_9MICO
MTAVHGAPQAAAGSRDLAPMTLERIQESLTRLGYSYVRDEEHPDVLRARFDDYRFHFLLVGENRGVLQTRGRWSHSVDISRKVEMLKLCNEWNMSRLWPKVYVRRESESVLSLYGEMSTDFFCGAVDRQIDRSISCGLSTVISFFHEVEGRLGPELEPGDS